MNQHLSEATIKDYLENSIGPKDILLLDDHIAECDDCVLALASAATNTGRDLDIPAFPVHLPFESLNALVNRTIDPIDEEIATVHLERCLICSDALKDLVALKAELDSSVVMTISNPEQSSFFQRFTAFFRPQYLVPAFCLIMVGIIGIWWFTSQTDSEQILISQSSDELPVVDKEPPADITQDGNLNANPAPAPAQTAAIVASLDDGGNKIEIYSDGRILGLASTQFEGRVRAALTKGELALPADVGRITSGKGTLMGGDDRGVPFALVSPVGSIIENTRPVFSWKPVSRAEQYKVEVFDDNFSRVATSPQLERSNWKSTQPLLRGKVYLWQVTALIDGREVRSPVRPAPDAKFKIISTPQANLIASVRLRGASKLTLGIAYAEAGMLNEAEREFAALLRLNPGSEVVRRLLAKVKAAS